MATLPTNDPMILEAIERAIEPYKHRLSPAALDIVHESGVKATDDGSEVGSAAPVDELARRRGAR
jgi:hypothetical protein